MGTREQAILLLNEAKLCGDRSQKVDHLRGLLELVANKQPDLVPEFLANIVELQADPAAIVRSFVAEFLEAAAQAAPSRQVLHQGVVCLASLARDEATAVARRAVVASYPVYRTVLALLAAEGCKQPVDTELPQLWQAAQSLEGTILDLAMAAQGNPAVRLLAIKFAQQAIMLLSAEAIPAVQGVLHAPHALAADHPVITKAALVRNAEQLLGRLLGLLKASHIDESIALPSVTACITSCGFIAQQRPQFLGRILPVLLALPQRCTMKVDSSGKGSDIAVTLQAALSSLLNSRHPMAAAWKNKLGDTLASMSSPHDEPPRPSKRRKEDANQEQTGGAAAAEGGQPDSQLAEVVSVLDHVVAAKDAAALAALIHSLQSPLIADLVLRYLSSLPPCSSLLPDHIPREGWVEEVLTMMSAQAVACVEMTPEAHAADCHDYEHSKVAGGPESLPATNLRSRHVPAPAGGPVQVTPADEGIDAVLQGALVRILCTTTAPPRLRGMLVARLTSMMSKQVQDCVVQRLLQDLCGGNGLEVAIMLLNALFFKRYHPDNAAAHANNGGSAVEVAAPAAGEGSFLRRHAPPAAAGDRHMLRIDAGTKDRYEALLLSLLQGMRDTLPASDRAIVTVLLHAPLLPMPGVHDFLQHLCNSGPEWATLALIAAKDVVLCRPPDRPAVLSVVLDAATSDDADVRGKAVRLLANRLFSEAGMAETIEHFAHSRLVNLAAPSQLGANENQATQQAPSLTEDAAFQACALYCALCTKKPSLLPALFEAFAVADDSGRAAIQRNAAGLAKTLGPSAVAWLGLVQDCPKGSIDLLLVMLSTLCDAAPLPLPLVQACVQLQAKFGDARVLVPALSGMDRSAALQALPALLDLPPDLLRVAIERLVTRVPASNASHLFTPPEMLAALHNVHPSGAPAGALQKAMAGITACINSPQLFTPEALAAAINQLLTRVPLPQLFMRTVIQSVSTAPKLRPFAVSVLEQLAAKHVWNDAAQWRGWVMCAHLTAPDSFPVMLQLPPNVLGRVLAATPATLRTQLAEFARSDQCRNTVSQPILYLLSAQAGK